MDQKPEIALFKKLGYMLIVGLASMGTLFAAREFYLGHRWFYFSLFCFLSSAFSIGFSLGTVKEVLDRKLVNFGRVAVACFRIIAVIALFVWGYFVWDILGFGMTRTFVADDAQVLCSTKNPKLGDSVRVEIRIIANGPIKIKRISYSACESADLMVLFLEGGFREALGESAFHGGRYYDSEKFRIPVNKDFIREEACLFVTFEKATKYGPKHFTKSEYDAQIPVFKP